MAQKTDDQLKKQIEQMISDSEVKKRVEERIRSYQAFSPEGSELSIPELWAITNEEYSQSHQGGYGTPDSILFNKRKTEGGFGGNIITEDIGNYPTFSVDGGRVKLTGRTDHLQSDMVKEAKQALKDYYKGYDLTNAQVAENIQQTIDEVNKQIKSNIDYQNFRGYLESSGFSEDAYRNYSLAMQEADPKTTTNLLKSKKKIKGRLKDGTITEEGMLPSEWIDYYKKNWNPEERAKLWMDSAEALNRAAQGGSDDDLYDAIPFILMGRSESINAPAAFMNQVNIFNDQGWEDAKVYTPIYGFDDVNGLSVFTQAFLRQLGMRGLGIASDVVEAATNPWLDLGANSGGQFFGIDNWKDSDFKEMTREEYQDYAQLARDAIAQGFDTYEKMKDEYGEELAKKMWVVNQFAKTSPMAVGGGRMLEDWEENGEVIAKEGDYPGYKSYRDFQSNVADWSEHGGGAYKQWSQSAIDDMNKYIQQMATYDPNAATFGIVGGSIASFVAEQAALGLISGGALTASNLASKFFRGVPSALGSLRMGQKVLAAHPQIAQTLAALAKGGKAGWEASKSLGNVARVIYTVGEIATWAVKEVGEDALRGLLDDVIMQNSLDSQGNLDYTKFLENVYMNAIMAGLGHAIKGGTRGLASLVGNAKTRSIDGVELNVSQRHELNLLQKALDDQNRRIHFRGWDENMHPVITVYGKTKVLNEVTASGDIAKLINEVTGVVNPTATRTLDEIAKDENVSVEVKQKIADVIETTKDGTIEDIRAKIQETFDDDEIRQAFPDGTMKVGDQTIRIDTKDFTVGDVGRVSGKEYKSMDEAIDGLGKAITTRDFASAVNGIMRYSVEWAKSFKEAVEQFAEANNMAVRDAMIAIRESRLAGQETIPGLKQLWDENWKPIQTKLLDLQEQLTGIRPVEHDFYFRDMLAGTYKPGENGSYSIEQGNVVDQLGGDATFDLAASSTARNTGKLGEMAPDKLEYDPEILAREYVASRMQTIWQSNDMGKIYETMQEAHDAGEFDMTEADAAKSVGATKEVAAEVGDSDGVKEIEKLSNVTVLGEDFGNEQAAIDEDIKAAKSRIKDIQAKIKAAKATQPAPEKAAEPSTAKPTDAPAPWQVVKGRKNLSWEDGTAKAREYIVEKSPIDLSTEYGSKDSLAAWLQEGRNEAYEGGDADEGVLKRWNSLPEEVRNEILKDSSFSRLWKNYSPAGTMMHLGTDNVFLPDAIDRIYADYLWRNGKGAGDVVGSAANSDSGKNALLMQQTRQTTELTKQLAIEKKNLADLEAQKAEAAKAKPVTIESNGEEVKSSTGKTGEEAVEEMATLTKKQVADAQKKFNESASKSNAAEKISRSSGYSNRGVRINPGPVVGVNYMPSNPFGKFAQWINDHFVKANSIKMRLSGYRADGTPVTFTVTAYNGGYKMYAEAGSFARNVIVDVQRGDALWDAIYKQVRNNGFFIEPSKNQKAKYGALTSNEQAAKITDKIMDKMGKDARFSHAFNDDGTVKDTAALLSILTTRFRSQGISDFTKFIRKSTWDSFTKGEQEWLNKRMYEMTASVNKKSFGNIAANIARFSMGLRYRSNMWFNYKNGQLQLTECQRLFTMNKIGDFGRTLKRLISDSEYRQRVSDYTYILASESAGRGLTRADLDKTAETFVKVGAASTMSKNGMLTNIDNVKAKFGEIDDTALASIEGGEYAKNYILIAGFVAAGEKQGLSGVELDNYVRNRFNTEALAGTKVGRIGLTDSKVGQFAFMYLGFPIRELALQWHTIRGGGLRKDFLGSVEYLTKMLGAKFVMWAAEAPWGYSLMDQLDLDPFGWTDQYSQMPNEPGERTPFWGGLDVAIQYNPFFQGAMTSALADIYFSYRAAQETAREEYKAEHNGSAEGFEWSLADAGGQMWEDLLHGLTPGYTEYSRISGEISDLDRGYRISSTGNRLYEPNTDPGNIAWAMLSGRGNTPNAQDYYQTAAPIRGLIEGGLPGLGQNIMRANPFRGFREFDPADTDTYEDWFNGSYADQQNWNTGIYSFRDEAQQIKEKYDRYANAGAAVNDMASRENELSDLRKRVERYVEAYMDKHPEGISSAKQNQIINIFNLGGFGTTLQEAFNEGQGDTDYTEWQNAKNRYSQGNFPTAYGLTQDDEGETEYARSPQLEQVLSQQRYGIASDAAPMIEQMYKTPKFETPLGNMTMKDYHDKVYAQLQEEWDKSKPDYDKITKIQEEYLEQISRNVIQPILNTYGSAVLSAGKSSDIMQEFGKMLYSMVPSDEYRIDKRGKQIYKSTPYMTIDIPKWLNKNFSKYTASVNTTNRQTKDRLDSIRSSLDQGHRSTAVAKARALIRDIGQGKASVSRDELEWLQGVLND